MFQGRLALGEQLHELTCTITGRFEGCMNHVEVCQNRKPINVTANTERWVRRHYASATPVGDDSVTIFDYVAIGVLVILVVWAVADWIPRGKL